MRTEINQHYVNATQTSIVRPYDPVVQFYISVQDPLGVNELNSPQHL